MNILFLLLPLLMPLLLLDGFRLPLRAEARIRELI